MPSNNPAFLLKPGEIHVWLFDLDNPYQDSSTWEGHLSEEEASHSKLYRLEQDRLRFIVRRGILRKLLGEYTGLEPSGIAFQTNPYGKLSLPSNPLKFNLSCCQSRVIFAFALEMEIGVDLEQVRPLAELERMVKGWLSPAERAGLLTLAPVSQMNAFFHIWTQKEALLKAHGKGLSMPLQEFSVSNDPNKAGQLYSINCGSDDDSHWRMISHVPEAGWWAAVCVRAEKNLQILWFMQDLVDLQSTVPSWKM